jgi:hypothetical protein
MLEITSYRNGEVLNYHNGLETDEFLEIKIEGIADSQSTVTANGQKADRCDRLFSATVRLKERVNKVVVNSHNKFGDFQQTITLVWDKKSFKRYAMRIDDNIFFLTDIARNKPKELFKHFYLNELKKINEKYGTKFILKCFYEDSHHKFTLKEFPDTYKQEFIDNSDWLKLSFHAYSEFPDKPYQHAPADKLINDFDLVKNEIIRFAGMETFTPPTNVHWAMLPPGLFKVMHDRGVRILTSGGFLSNRIMVEGKVVEVYDCSCDIGFFYEQDVAQYMKEKRLFYDVDYDLFLSRTFFCCNIDTKEEIESKIRAADSLENGTQTIEAVTHEQYSFPDYYNYLPDHFERIETACRLLTELNYKPVYFGEGILGNNSWEGI